MRRLLVALLISLVGVVGVPAPTGATTSYERDVVRLINVTRERHGLGLVSWGGCLYGTSDRHLVQLDDRAPLLLWHSNLGLPLTRCDKRMVGEVLAYGFASPADVVRAWMLSPAHRKVLLRARYTRVGVAAEYVNGEWLVVAQFGARG